MLYHKVGGGLSLTSHKDALSFVQILPEKKSLASFCPCRVGKVASLLFWWMRAWLVPNTAVSQRVRTLPLGNSVASQAVFQVTCCTISGGCQSWSIRLSDAFNTQYYSTFLAISRGKLCAFVFCVCFCACESLCVNIFASVCSYVYSLSLSLHSFSLRSNSKAQSVCCAREPTFLSDPSPIVALSCLSVAHWVLLLRLDWRDHGVWRFVLYQNWQIWGMAIAMLCYAMLVENQTKLMCADTFQSFDMKVLELLVVTC